MINNIQNTHTPVLMKEILSFVPSKKYINVIDATFGGGGYSKTLLENYKINKLYAIDRDPIVKVFSRKLEKKYPNKFFLFNDCFSNIDKLIENKNIKTKEKLKFDIILFDLGLSSNQLNDSKRGFSFLYDGELDMNMGKSKILARDIINKFSEKQLAEIFYNLGNERYAKKIAKNIIKQRKIKVITKTLELVKIIENSVGLANNKKSKINPATKTFQALRIYVNNELNELKIALEKSQKLLLPKGKILIVSFHSLEDKIVKDCFNHLCGKRWRSSRHYPELVDHGPITFKLITKKPIRPSEMEIINNPRSRSAKLRVAEKVL